MDIHAATPGKWGEIWGNKNDVSKNELLTRHFYVFSGNFWKIRRLIIHGLHGGDKYCAVGNIQLATICSTFQDIITTIYRCRLW